MNKHGRPFRLKLKAGEEKYAINRYGSDGPCFGGGCDVAIWADEDGSHCSPFSFELDTEVESKAGQPPLLFAYGKALLSGVDDQRVSKSYFSLAELECYTLDA